MSSRHSTGPSRTGRPSATRAPEIASSWSGPASTASSSSTHDLDFGAILAASRATAPSVVQVRTQDVTPGYLTPSVVAALRQHEPEIRAGALVSLDELTLRVRLLPLT